MVNIVSVVTNSAQYKQLFTDNTHLSGTFLYSYDNTQQNLPIPTRYNDFITNHLPEDEWIVFCHQDFEFLQPPQEVLENLNKNFIYGPIGVALKRHRFVYISLRPFWKPAIRLRYTFFDETFGQIIQGSSKGDFKNGKKISSPKLVDTVDCCCLIVHSSLIKKHHLRFDPQFDFHLYSEDFSLAARKKGVLTKALQIHCKHYSLGNLNDSFWQKYRLLLTKYPNELFLTTCVTNPHTILQNKCGPFETKWKVLLYGDKLI